MRKVNIACVREIKWVGSKTRDVDGYKLWYFGVLKGKSGVGILVDRDLRESVVEVRRVNDRLMTIKLEVGDRGVHGGNFNGHILSTVGGYGKVYGDFDFGDRNGGGTSLLDSAKAFEIVIANSSFQKRDEHLFTFQSAVVKTQIDYLLLRRCDRRLCRDCKVILGKTLATQYRLLAMDVSIMIKRKKRFVRGQSRIRWGTLTKDKA
uniref:Craniofacial development protein 2-like n=1 Tax=Nicotiana tabacum TaxID=4097 RepID=A0A1S4A9U0_TOBAC|nr:PREDICTED: uncharacterized protein LOC107795306 [Nicotiana tabacum]